MNEYLLVRKLPRSWSEYEIYNSFGIFLNNKFLWYKLRACKLSSPYSRHSQQLRHKCGSITVAKHSFVRGFQNFSNLLSCAENILWYCRYFATLNVVLTHFNKKIPLQRRQLSTIELHIDYYTYSLTSPPHFLKNIYKKLVWFIQGPTGLLVRTFY